MLHKWPSSSWCNTLAGRTLGVMGDNELLRAQHTSDRGPLFNGQKRLALVLEYDGTSYKGFQLQASAPSIQGEVERAIARLTGEMTRVRGASRTDTGAHAKGQVVDFLTRARYTTETFINALNSYLPPDIKVRGAWDIPLDFNSRKDAVGRVYRYRLLNSRWPSALARRSSHWVSPPLDVARMREATVHLLGTHDYSSFTGSMPPGRSTIRQIRRWDVWRQGELVLIEAEANSFLPRQIRRTNGILVEIGLNRLPVDMIKGMLDGAFGTLKRWPMLPAKGLCLMEVSYPDLQLTVQGDYEET